MNDDKRMVGVTGATGFVGQALCRSLKNLGYSVKALVSSESEAEPIRDFCSSIHPGRLRDKGAIADLLVGAEAVFHLAGIVGGAGKLENEYWDVNVTATKELLVAAHEAGVKRFVYCSTADLLGDIATLPGDEESPLEVTDIYQMTKKAGEKIVLAANGKKGLETTVVRPTIIYGPGDMRRYKFFKGVADGAVTIYGDGENHIHPVYIDDAVAGLVAACQSPKAPGRIYLVGGDRYVTVNQWIDLIAGAVGVSPGVNRRRAGLARFIARTFEKVCLAFRIEPPIFRRNIEFFLKDRGYCLDRARDELDYQPRVTLEEGIGKTVGWYREQNLL